LVDVMGSKKIWITSKSIDQLIKKNQEDCFLKKYYDDDILNEYGHTQLDSWI